MSIRVLLAVLWVSHFMLWTFGDMFSLAQEMGEPVTDSMILIIAPTTAFVQALTAVYCLVGRPAHVRWANLILAPVYLLANVVFLVAATQAWESYLGAIHVLFNVLILWFAYRWPTSE